MSATKAGVQSTLCRITRKLNILLHYACHMVGFMFEKWVNSTVATPREVPATNPPGQSRGISLHSSVAVDDDVRDCTKVTPSLASPIPRLRKRDKDQTHHDPTAGVRQDEAETTQSTGLLQAIGEPIPDGPSSDSLPREEAVRIKREYISVNTKKLPRIPYFLQA